MKTKMIISKIFYSIFFCVFLGLFFKILLRDSIHHYDTMRLLQWLLLGVGAVSLSFCLLTKYSALIEQHYWKILVIFVGLFFCISLVNGFKLRFTPAFDMDAIYGGAIQWLEDGTFSSYYDYYGYFPNNIGSMIILYMVFSFVSAVFRITDYFAIGIVFNSILLAATALVTSLVCRKLRNCVAGVMALIFFILCVPFSIMGAAFYTDSLSLLFPILFYYLYLCFKEQNTWKKRLIFAIGMAIVLTVGMIIKFTVLIALIAVVIDALLCMNWKSVCLLAGCSIFLAWFLFGIMNLYIYSVHLDKEQADQKNTPYLHWVMMGMTNNGGYNPGDYEYTRSFGTLDERNKACLARIKERFNEMGSSGLAELFVRKAVICFGDGTYALSDFLDDSPQNDTWLHRYVLYAGDKYSDYSYMATGFLLTVYFFMFMGSIKCLRENTYGKELSVLAPLLTCLGIMAFLLLWETSGRYFTNFVPLMLVSAVLPLGNVKAKKAKKGVHNNKKHEDYVLRNMSMLCCFVLLCCLYGNKRGGLLFDGNMSGNIIGILFLFAFQAAGIWIANRVLAKEHFSFVFVCLIGSVLGTLMLQWFPILFAFVFDFTETAHLFALLLLCVLCMVVERKTKGCRGLWDSIPYKNKKEWIRLIKENPCIVLMTVTFFFFAYCLITHTIPNNSDGSMHTGQATYGDMNMHLGFITSIARQKSFPPDYSIYPGVRIGYPFLCDSISSSLYIWGSSLQLAYIFPMLIAICQVMGGFYCFIKYWFQKSSSALIAWVMFFIDGGLGFIYFTDMESIKRNFTDFYYTPTSLGDMNMRWAQIIANMLIPQRATLFGWAVLFPLLALFLCAMRKKSQRCFVIAAIFAGALPMVHTHSFLGFGLVCTMWLLYDCKQMCDKENGKQYLLTGSVIIGLVFFSILQKINSENGIVNEKGMLIMGVGVGILVIYILYFVFKIIFGAHRKALLETWGVFLAVIIVLALPQLLFWTFRQVGANGIVRGHFNWSNEGDQYIWFYIKNIGLTFVLFVCGFLSTTKKNLQIASPLLLIWFVAELVVFQPNIYDNNKLLFVGFVFMCGLAANFIVDIFAKKWPQFMKIMIAAGLIFFGTISALLTLGREYVSDYQLYSADSVEACRFIEKNIKPEAIILTASNHNNAVASLTGRNIVCGSGTFLYFHGVDYSEREKELSLMYQDPVGNFNLYEKYHVEYVYISGYESGTFTINEAGLQQIANCIYSNNEVSIYAVNGAGNS